MAQSPAVDWKDQTLATLARMALVKRRLRALGAGARSTGYHSPVFTLIFDQLRSRWLTRRYRRWQWAQQ